MTYFWQNPIGGRKRTVKLDLVAEVVVRVQGEQSVQDLRNLARERLDAFREATQPSREWGITLYENSGKMGS